ncbi:baseplate J/gp47 family protein [Marinobacterium sp. YM272]|uniref:baseplate J/gp47 family protein n=1 Tax=Marinobacterium sp. YM272 TaxID=3421654 RepID=UPI003D7FB8C3
MSHPCNRPNPLKLSGTSRADRRLKALQPDHFQVDERTLADFILFARRYADNIRYYGHDAPENASWRPLFEQDVSVNLAALASLPLSSFLQFKQSLVSFLKQGAGQPDEVLNAHFTLYLQLPLLLLDDLSQCYARLARSESLGKQLEHWAGRELGSDLLLLKSYLLGAETAPLSGFVLAPLDSAPFNTDPDLPSPLPLVPESVRERITGDDWNETADRLFDCFDSLNSAELAAVSADPAPYQLSATTAEQIDDALRYNLLAGAVERLLSAVNVVLNLASEALEASLLRDDHSPHYGLWLTFLKLYQHPKQLLNRFTQRHLDFYYRDVLQLGARPPQPDRAALVIELARQHAEYRLPAGTRFDGGKDDEGKQRVYEILEDTLFNQAQIADLKSFYCHQQGSESFAYAALKTDTADGVDADLDKAYPQWPPFGPVHENSLAQVGIAVADSKLRMSDGSRSIRLRVELSGSVPSIVQQVFGAALTTEDGWLELTGSQFSVNKSGNDLSFVITLDGEQPPISGYNAAQHGFNFTTTEPVLRLWLRPDSGRFAEWLGVQTTALSLQCSVQGSRSYSLSSSQGSIDPSKPFMPFGAQPRANAEFIIGGRELFSKPLQRLTLRPSWQEPLSLNSHYYTQANPFMTRAQVSYLKGGQWQSIDDDLMPLLLHSASSDTVEQFFGLLVWAFLFGATPEEIFYNDEGFWGYIAASFSGQGLTLEGLDTSGDYDRLSDTRAPASVEGFVRLTLKDSFGHFEFPQENALAIMGLNPDIDHSEKAGVNYDDEGLPKPPYTPVISDLKLDYQTSDDPPQQLFHQYPFGAVTSRGPELFPELSNRGELYIGLEKADPPQSVSLLFAAVEGSANPLKNPVQLRWDYLRDDAWVEIPANRVSDSSASLSGSGIIAFELPGDANTEHRLLPSGLHWLRLSVESDPDALANLLSIQTQAVAVQRVEVGAGDRSLALPLPAGAISKLKVPDTAVKKIQQPLASAGGAAAESTDDYYQRVSERLRHKNRAVTIWDYERLVLQQFPQVYKVRCLNHTALCRDAQNEVVAENGIHPGSVLVVPIPVIDPDSASDPHRPYNTTQTLAAIDRWLRKRISPFVKLEVQNPNIEEIQLRFEVALREEIIDTGFYLELLNQEINRYLMPWAYGGDAQVDFGGKWYKSMLVNFIDERPYVDYVKNVMMFHRTDITSASMSWQNRDLEVVTASSARSILVSHPQHEISAIVGVNV